MNRIFITADQHFGHSTIMRHANRPFSSLYEHDKALAAAWNDTVPRDGVVYALGDLCWRPNDRTLALVACLHGRKRLFMGNHDRVGKELASLLDEVHESAALVSLGGRRYWMSHYAHRVWNRSHYGIGHLFGHSHNRLETFNLSTDVGVDCWEKFGTRPYAPIPLEAVEAWMDARAADMRLAGRAAAAGVGGKTLWRQDDVFHFAHRAGALQHRPALMSGATEQPA